MKNIFLFCLVFFAGNFSMAQTGLLILKSNTEFISIRDGDVLKKNEWRVSPLVNPDIYESSFSGRKQKLTFISDIDSISFIIKPGQTVSFIVLLNGKDSAYTQIKGSRIMEKVNFTRKYIRLHNNKTTVEVPEVYELFNVILAMTDYSRNNKWLIKKETDYYQSVADWFGLYSKELAVSSMNLMLEKNGWLYTKLKQESYCFEFNKKGKIIQSRIYGRMWGKANDLLPYINQLQEFANKSQFRAFYSNNKPIYEKQIAFYRDTANIAGMISWLRKNFPSSDYNCFKVIFSPLVSGYQSAQGFSNNGFKEAQAHVNFPYLRNKILSASSDASVLLAAGDIVFTEFNHSFINPESEKPEYASDVNTICSNLSHWMEDKAKSGYGSSYSCFNEYMNWALVSLRYVDYAPKDELSAMLKNNEDYMQKGRGFKKFPEFSRFLVEIYQKRKPGQVVADLYPQIIGWFKQNQ